MFDMTNPADKYEFTGLERDLLKAGVDLLHVRMMVEAKIAALSAMPHDTPNLALASLCNELLLCEIDIHTAKEQA